jgi:hypothetical protein
LCAVTGGPYVALSHQHTVWALQYIKNLYNDTKKALPEWLRFVKANVLKHDTPLAIRRLVSGSDQNREAVVRRVRLSRVIHVFLSIYPEDSTTPVYDAVKEAIAVTGFRRPATNKQLTDDWSGVIQFALHARNLAVPALEKLEAHGLAQTTTSVRCLKKLMFPSARAAIAEKMMTGIRTQQQLESAVAQVQHDQLVTVHWRRGNPNIPEEKSMPFLRVPPTNTCNAHAVTRTRASVFHS